MVKHEKGLWHFSYAACHGDCCLEGRLTECKRFKDHLVTDPYLCTQSQKSQSQAVGTQDSLLSSLTKIGSKIGSDLSQAAKEVMQNRKNSTEQVNKDLIDALHQDTPVVIRQDFDTSFPLSESESEIETNDEQSHGLQLVVECQYLDGEQKRVCDGVTVVNKLVQYTQANKAYCSYEVTKKYIEILRLSPAHTNTTVLLTHEELDAMQGDTNDFKCDPIKRHQRIMQVDEMSKLTSLGPETKVQVICVLFGHRNMKLQHTLNHGRRCDIYNKNKKDGGIDRPKREPAGHFMNGLTL